MVPKYEVQIKSSHTSVKKLKYYSSILADLDSVQKALNVKHEKNNHIITQSIFAFSIITYARVFVSGDRTKLNIKTIKTINPEEKEFHKKLISMRHQYVAHAGNNEYEHTEVYLLLDETKRYVIENIHQNTQMFNFNQDEIRKFLSLISKVKLEVNKQSEIFAKKYLNSLSTIELEQLRQTAVPHQKIGTLYASDYKIPKE